MPRAQPQSAPVQSPRLHLLREEIAGIESLSGEPRRIPLGHARLDRLLVGGPRLGALHEIVAARPGDHSAATGFALALAAHLCAARRPIVWIGEDFAAREQGALYGPGLAFSGIDPASLLLVHVAQAKEALWATEEALKCQAPGAVVCEIFTTKAYDLTASRRLVLAAQKHATPALLILAGRTDAGAFSSGADTRFEIRAHPSPHQDSAGRRMPLPGFAVWSARVAKARAGPAGLDSDFHPVFWTEASFRDALSLPLAAVSSDRPDHPAGGGRRAFGS